METQISGLKADRVIKIIGLPYWHRVEAVGYSGGIWVLWKDNIRVEVMGFNALLDEDEKEGGSKRVCSVCELKDLGFRGPKFTWNRGNIFECLDRALCDSRWELLFPNIVVFHMLIIKSVHCQFSILFGNKIRTNSPRPFWFLSG
ncbi:Endonuclease/exonuclease/phosphatase [Gossypium australe]|uniref:Endonuclease/exonuclease/phosphatase n=1 Tax=Gossypium australe TaxID=47621 RepID=A0A5B6VW45_9ROSI|nr:Endonuclease/exonuclease/phosphatase [Gossypium australe]